MDDDVGSSTPAPPRHAADTGNPTLHPESPHAEHESDLGPHDAHGQHGRWRYGSPQKPAVLADLADSHSLAIYLEPAIREACGGRLGPIEWFHAAWQHGGAATGFAPWTDPADPAAPHKVFVKLPVGPRELTWSRDLALAPCADPRGPFVPRFLAGSDSIGGADLCWLVVEALDGKPLSTGFDEHAIRELLRTLLEFQVTATKLKPPADDAKPLDWSQNILRAKQAVRASKMADANRWIAALKGVHKHLGHILARWNSREINTWCHGDLHPGNAIRREARAHEASAHNPSPRCVLIDMALVHSGHWAEDAVYLERQFWGHHEQLFGIKPLAELSRLRREAGLPIDPHATDVAIARRLLMASVVPLFIDREHNTKYVRGALEIIEKFLPQLH